MTEKINLGYMWNRVYGKDSPFNLAGKLLVAGPLFPLFAWFCLLVVLGDALIFCFEKKKARTP